MRNVIADAFRGYGLADEPTPSSPSPSTPEPSPHNTRAFPGLRAVADAGRSGYCLLQPERRPRSSWKRFCADLPNELWQADVTHWRLADHTEVEILDILDDHSRTAIASHARPVTTGPDVVDTFTTAFGRWGTPAGALTDIQSV